MTLARHVARVLDLVRDTRRQLEDRGAGAPGVRANLDTLDDELCRLQTLTEECDVKQSVFEIVAHVRDPEEALTRALEFLTAHLDVDASGLRLREGDDFPYFITNGFSKEFVATESGLCRKDESGGPARDDAGDVVLECMCGNVIQGRTDPSKPFFTSRGSFWTNSTSCLLQETTENERLGATRNRCHGEGYESVALIPLRAREETFGLLQFNDRDTGKFTPQKIALLEDLADHLAHLLV